MWDLGFVGFGNVGQGLAKILEEKRDVLKQRYGFEYRVTFISTGSRGALLNPSGIDLGSALGEVGEKGTLQGHPDATGEDALSLISGRHAQVIAEATVTDLKRGEPGLTHVRTALEKGIHVVSTNKGPVSAALPELAALAKDRGVSYLFEGVVMSGTPARTWPGRPWRAATSAGPGASSTVPPTTSSPGWKRAGVTKRPSERPRNWATPRLTPRAT